MSDTNMYLQKKNQSETQLQPNKGIRACESSGLSLTENKKGSWKCSD